MFPNGLIYKYVTTDRIDVLKDCRIRFTQPDALNDPFESCPCLIEFNRDKMESLQQKSEDKFGEFSAELTQQMRQDLVNVMGERLPEIMGNVFGFLSVSQVPDNLLMWSHYAGSHSGFVIGFDPENPFLKPGGMSLHGLKPVRYSRERFVLPARGFMGMDAATMEAANEQFFFTKSIDWRYEQEMRVLAMPHRADKSLTFAGQPPIHLFNFPKEAIQQVMLGIRTPANIRAEIAGLLDEKYPDVSLLQAKMHRTDYALEFVPYSQFAREEERLTLVKQIFQYRFEFTDPKPEPEDTGST
ncbi:MAG: DUF2971 domain-containing protein [Thermoplasmata archaeon]|nr:DUF2971 domain-containing protein [Thermoplasmata archaeon]